MKASPAAPLLTLVALACTLFQPALAADGVKTPPFERVQLGNGSVLLLMEQHDVPLVAFHALLRGGATSDPPDGYGTSSLLAGLLEKGAGSRDAAAFAEAVASVGGNIETEAGVESISVRGSFLARDQALMVELLADMLQRPKLEHTQFDTLRARHIEFIRAAKDSNVGALTSIYGTASLFSGHPYGRPVDGSEASLGAIGHEALQRYYREQIGADRLILAVAGDFKTAQLKQQLTRAFAGWRKAASPPPSVPKLERPTARRVLLVDAPDSVQSYFWAASLAVPRNDPRRAALDVTNTLFGGRFTSMLNSELRVRTGLSYGAGSRFDRRTVLGHWELSSFTQTATTIEAIDLALATLDKLHAGAIDAAMLASGKSYVQGQFPLALETADQWAQQLASLELYGLDRRYVDDYAAAIDALALDDARRVIGEVFPKSGELVIVVIGNAAAIREGLSKYGTVTQMKLADPAFAPRMN
jgi:zinc protease